MEILERKVDVDAGKLLKRKSQDDDWLANDDFARKLRTRFRDPKYLLLDKRVPAKSIANFDKVKTPKDVVKISNDAIEKARQDGKKSTNSANCKRKFRKT